jgi:predicted nucleic acid-binding protein
VARLISPKILTFTSAERKLLNKVFIDTSFVVTLVNEKDQHHDRASKLADLFDGYPLITTDAVLVEIGNALARNFKEQATEVIGDFLTSDEVEIVNLDSTLFQSAFELYGTHKDKSWGMTDCISFIVMREYGVIDALTHDKDFRQAGFNALMRES